MPGMTKIRNTDPLFKIRDIELKKMTLFGGVDSHSLNKLILRVTVRCYVKYTLFQ